ncbi:GFA family protein [Pseudoalteromonas xiamenensis]|uniref:GFA family protein n=1 Tax=Pseudoalteromonas xiamenensis TaxID=882626 RepID=A0A975HL46_9GAMM|nr:GFA family protein [Pseudoalteromonas xiamenensis]QTH71577.1 GFA family protein [Pseudoalteromonas xiamenensis]
MIYQGSCHCKAVKFEFESELITDALQCNCSICIRKNAIMSKQIFDKADFKILSGRDNLQTYNFNDHDVNHYFCKTCGIYPFHDLSFDPDKFRVNYGCVEGIEPRSLNIAYFDGRNEL